MAQQKPTGDGLAPVYDNSLVLMRLLLSSFSDNTEMGIAYEAILQMGFRIYHWNVEKMIEVMNELEVVLRDRPIKVRLGDEEVELEH